MRWIGMDCKYMRGICYWAVASIDFFGCCSLYRTIYEARRRWLCARYGLHHSWRAIRRASLFAPLKLRLSCSPAKLIVPSVPAHIALHLFVSTHSALHLFVSTHIALHRRVRMLHTVPTQPSVGMYEFFPDADMVKFAKAEGTFVTVVRHMTEWLGM
jgi:hypothetical protein